MEVFNRLMDILVGGFFLRHIDLKYLSLYKEVVYGKYHTTKTISLNTPQEKKVFYKNIASCVVGKLCKNKHTFGAIVVSNKTVDLDELDLAIKKLAHGLGFFRIKLSNSHTEYNLLNGSTLILCKCVSDVKYFQSIDLCVMIPKNHSESAQVRDVAKRVLTINVE